MLSLRTASPTNVPDQTASSTCCLVTSVPGCSINNLRTAKAFGRNDMARVPCQRHSFMRSSRNPPNAISFAACIAEISKGRVLEPDVAAWMSSIQGGCKLSRLLFNSSKPAFLSPTKTSPQHDDFVMTGTEPVATLTL